MRDADASKHLRCARRADRHTRPAGGRTPVVLDPSRAGINARSLGQVMVDADLRANRVVVCAPDITLHDGDLD